MAGLVVSANDAVKAKCIERWYFKDVAKAEIRLRGAMKRFPNYHPRGVIAAVIEKECGSFKFR